MQCHLEEAAKVVEGVRHWDCNKAQVLVDEKSAIRKQWETDKAELDKTQKELKTVQERVNCLQASSTLTFLQAP